MSKKFGQTLIVIPNARDENPAIMTDNPKWIRRLEALIEAGHVEEVESEQEGARQFELEAKKMIRLPYFRTARTYTKAERKAAAERLAAVREAVQASKAGAKKAAKKSTKPVVEDEEDEEVVPVKKSKFGIPGKASVKAGPAPKAIGSKKSKKVVEEEEDLDEDELDADEAELEEELDDELELEEEEDEEEEVVVKSKKPAAKKAKK